VVIGHADGRVEVRDLSMGTIENERIEFAETENIFRDVAD
jgi:ribose 5-phosphate isomerase A